MCHLSYQYHYPSRGEGGNRYQYLSAREVDGSVDLIDRKSRKADAHVILAATIVFFYSVITVLLSTCDREWVR